MSYEPHLLINWEDLSQHSAKINGDAKIQKVNGWKKAYEELNNALNETSVISFRNGLKVVLIHPEFTGHNANVRKLLDIMDIEYKTCY